MSKRSCPLTGLQIKASRIYDVSKRRLSSVTAASEAKQFASSFLDVLPPVPQPQPEPSDARKLLAAAGMTGFSGKHTGNWFNTDQHCRDWQTMRFGGFNVR